MEEWSPATAAHTGRPPLIGLTGPIGCGKSTIGRMLAELGGTVIDADNLAHRATARGAPAVTLIRQRFGENVIGSDGDLDRAAVARIVFEDQTALHDLESIVHPEVRRLLETELDSAAATGVPFVALEAIKLVEGGLAERCDEVWIVECGAATQRERLALRGAEAADTERRLAVQGFDLADSLAALLDERHIRCRRVSTELPIDDLRARVEDHLADVLARVLGIG